MSQYLSSTQTCVYVVTTYIDNKYAGSKVFAYLEDATEFAELRGALGDTENSLNCTVTKSFLTVTKETVWLYR